MIIKKGRHKMDQNQAQNVDDDLQKAIDNITNTTNIDPVFSDPVAAPSTIPEGDTGELDEPVGPFPEPVPEILPPAPEPTMPADLAAPAPLPNFNEMPPMPGLEPVPSPEPMLAPEPIAEPIAEPTPEVPAAEEVLSMHEVKEAALRDLVPILDHLNINVSQKFNIYKDIFETLKDYTVLSRAYEAAKQIENDAERAEALLYLIESIDRM